ncbi:hypothetical protein CJP46_02500 [Paenibacillus sp. XY044]|nr:hypothetical protein CJP46_02500 [Paenibacillus sp. XY044]
MHKVTLTNAEIAEYTKNRQAIRDSRTRFEVRYHTEMCLGILQRGRNRYIDSLEHEITESSSDDI